jgi:glutaredoxin
MSTGTSQIRPEVIVYSTPTCSACRTVKDFLSRNHVAFDDRNIALGDIAEEAALRFGAYFAPAVIVNGHLIEGGLPQIAEALGLEL